MSEYLFYNTEGFTQGPNVNDIEISAIYQIISINFMAKPLTPVLTHHGFYLL